MKLERCVLALVAGMALAVAGAGCRLPGGDDDPDQGPPGAQAPNGNPRSQNGDDNGMRRARRHHGRHGRGRWDGRRRGGGDGPGPGDNRGGWGNRGNDGPPPVGPDQPDDR